MPGLVRTLRDGECTPPVDNRIGDAFWVVNEVYKNLAYIKYLADHLNDIGVSGSKSFVAITDITATSTGAVGTKVRSDDEYVLQSCVTSTMNITVHVLAITGKAAFKPSVLVNGVSAILVRNEDTDVWVGTAELTLTGSAPYTITATHIDGFIDTATVTLETVPVVTNIDFTGAYPLSAQGQTEHAAGQTLNLTITANGLFSAYEVIYQAGLTATIAKAITEITPANTITFQVTVPDQGSYGTGAPLILPAKIRIRSANGTWGEVISGASLGGVNGTNVIALNNTYPVITFGSVTYPASQTAIKDTEFATIPVTYDNTDSVLYSSTQLTVTGTTVMGNKTAYYNSGGYNVTTNNLQVVANRDANATTATFNTLVRIAETAPTITATYPAVKLRSGVTPQVHTVILNSNQLMQATPVMAGDLGTIGTTTGSGTSFSVSITVADSDIKGNGTLSVTAVNLAGKTVTVINPDYELAGFVARTVTMASLAKEIAIGTHVAYPNKVIISVNGMTGTYENTLTNFVRGGASLVTKFAITEPSLTLSAQGNILYLNEGNLTDSNVSGNMNIIIEETL